MNYGERGGVKSSHSAYLESFEFVKHSRGTQIDENGNSKKLTSKGDRAKLSKSNNQTAGLLRFARNDNSKAAFTLVKGATHVAKSDNQRRAAFTLVEVLITLGIIGVVAAMTLPTLIRNYEEHVTVNKVKKFYSMINQAYLQSVNDNGYANEWHVDNGHTAVTANQLAGYIKPYLKISKDCGTSTNKCLGYQNNIKYLNQSNYFNYDSDSRYYKIILHDGSYLWFRAADTYCATSDGGYSDVCGLFWYDVNGNKGLNTIGVDVFVFYFTPTGIKPAYSTVNDCKKTSSGWSCARYILEQGDMKYLH